ncbi:MAG: hypothetical protein WBX01_14070 [Nitrososphaeraceae archaeon]|jgi:hypothetical protein
MPDWTFIHPYYAGIVMEDRTENISKCEINGVLQANHRKLVKMKNIPEPVVENM